MYVNYAIKYSNGYCYTSVKMVVIIWPIAIAQHGTDYKILSSSQSVCSHYGCNFCSILMKFCTEVRGRKSRNELVSGYKSDDPFLYFLSVFLPHNAFSVGRCEHHREEVDDDVTWPQKVKVIMVMTPKSLRLHILTTVQDKTTA